MHDPYWRPFSGIAASAFLMEILPGLPFYEDHMDEDKKLLSVRDAELTRQQIEDWSIKGSPKVQRPFGCLTSPAPETDHPTAVPSPIEAKILRENAHPVTQSDIKWLTEKIMKADSLEKVPLGADIFRILDCNEPSLQKYLHGVGWTLYCGQMKLAADYWYIVPSPSQR